MPLSNAFRDYLATRITSSSGTPFDSPNSYIGVGNGTTAFAATQTDLQGASKLRKLTDATYPQVTANVMVFRSTFATTDANFAWEEWGVFNALSGGVMMNRVVQSNGTKSSAETKQVTVTITVSV